MDIHVAECAEIRAHSRDPVCDFEKKQKNKNKTISLWINLWRPSLVLLLKWLDVWMWLHSLESFCFCYLVMLMSLGTLQIIELMISFLQAPFKELYFCFVWSVVQTLEQNCIFCVLWSLQALKGFCNFCLVICFFILHIDWPPRSFHLQNFNRSL